MAAQIVLSVSYWGGPGAEPRPLANL